MPELTPSMRWDYPDAALARARATMEAHAPHKVGDPPCDACPLGTDVVVLYGRIREMLNQHYVAMTLAHMRVSEGRSAADVIGELDSALSPFFSEADYRASTHTEDSPL